MLGKISVTSHIVLLYWCLQPSIQAYHLKNLDIVRCKRQIRNNVKVNQGI